VEGAHRDRVGLAGADEPRDALAQLARRLVGEGDRQHALRRHARLLHEVRNASGEHPRLPRARAGGDA